MSDNNIVADYKRFLPHIQLADCVLFVTWRMAFSLPKTVIDAHNERKENFRDEVSSLSLQKKATMTYNFQKKQMDFIDNILGKDKSLPNLLSNDLVIQTLGEMMQSYDKVKYELYCFCIMPNHVHLLIKPLKKDGVYYALPNIMHSIKSLSANRINRLLNRKGRLWQVENYDHLVRNEEELNNIIRYIVFNPVKASLCGKPEEWKGTFLTSDFCKIEDVR